MDPGLKIAGVTRRWEYKFFALKQFRFLIDTFRNDPLFCHSRNLLSGIQRFLLREAFSPSVSLCFLCLLFFKGVIRGIYPLYSSGPRLKDCRGDGTRCHCEPRGSVWRGNPKFFTLSNLLFSFLRLRKARSPPQSLLAMTEKGGFPLPLFRFLIDTFRNDPLFCHSRNLLSGIQVFAFSFCVFVFSGGLQRGAVPS